MTFIVNDETIGQPAILLCKSTKTWTQVPKSGVLVNGIGRATGFSSRAEALAAIRRTRRYDKFHKILRHEYTIMRVFQFLNIK